MSLSQRIEPCPECDLDVAWLRAEEGKPGLVLVEAVTCVDTDELLVQSRHVRHRCGVAYVPPEARSVVPAVTPALVQPASAPEYQEPPRRRSPPDVVGSCVRVGAMLEGTYEIMEALYARRMQRLNDAPEKAFRYFVDPVSGRTSSVEIDGVAHLRGRWFSCIECEDTGAIFVEEVGFPGGPRNAFLCDCRHKEKWRIKDTDRYRLKSFYAQFGIFPADRRGQLRIEAES